MDDYASSDIDGPACVRPVQGRETTAFAAFFSQNYDHLPPHMFLLHGHESAWHQARSGHIQIQIQIYAS